MKILAVGDFHGKFPKKIKKYSKEVDLILSPGDLSDRKERKYLFKYAKEISMGIPLTEFVSRKKLANLFKQNLRSMRYVIKELDKLQKPVYIVPGNCDFTELRIKKKVLKEYGLSGKYQTMQEMIKKTKNLKLLFHSRIKLKEVDLIGFSIYSYLKNPLKVLKKLFSKSKRKTLLLTHEPPYKTKLDKVNNPKSPMNGKHVGVKIYNTIDKKYKPLLHICGHIHEAQGKTRIGNTIVINTGYGGAGHFALIEINKGKISNILLK